MLAEHSNGFANATIDRLQHIVMRGCAREQSASRCEDSVISTLEELAGGDIRFGKWCQSVFARPDFLNACKVNYANSHWRCLSHQLAEWLLKCSEWSQRLTSTQSAAANMLLDLAHLAIRFRALEENANRELDQRKSKALYNLAYGLSHELNNPLANIATRAGVLLNGETAVDRRLLLEAIIDNAMRGCEMLGDLMLVAKPPNLELENICPASFLSAVVDKVSVLAAQRDISFRWICGELPRTRLCPVAMTEALWCLLRNGIEALNSGGTLEFAAQHLGDFIQLSIVDNGPGLSLLALKNCFDPYFSGREAGRGLGLGLAKAKRIIELHQGSLSIDNRCGGGCAAIVQLPICLE